MNDHQHRAANSQNDAPSFGFHLLSRKQKLKLDLDSGGHPALESLIDALIRSGFDHRDDIIAEITDITGDHVVDMAMEILIDGSSRGLWLMWGDEDELFSPRNV